MCPAGQVSQEHQRFGSWRGRQAPSPRIVIAQMGANMAEMSSMSESEIHAVMEEQACKQQKDKSKFLEYRKNNTQGDMESQFHC
jgi:hypothetical protein